MSNSPQNQNRPAQNAPSSSQPNAGKVGNNTHKDEPTAQKKAGEAKDNTGNKSSLASKPAKAS